MKLGFPFLSPVGANPPRNDYSDQRYQPQVRLVMTQNVGSSLEIRVQGSGVRVQGRGSRSGVSGLGVSDQEPEIRFMV